MRLYISHPFAVSCILLFLLFGDSSGILHCCLAAMLLHESGHITVYRFLLEHRPLLRVHLGGLALQWKDLTAEQWKEACILAAGPAVNLLTAGLFFILTKDNAKLMYYYFGGVNLLMACFNLLPLGFLDGGRLLQLALKNLLAPQTVLYICDLLQWISLAALCVFLLAGNTGPVTRVALLCFLAYFCAKSFCVKN